MGIATRALSTTAKFGARRYGCNLTRFVAFLGGMEKNIPSAIWQVTHATASSTVRINASVEAVFARWSRMEDFPSFMEGVLEMRPVGEKQFILKSESGGVFYESTCEIVLRIPQKRLAWRTLAGPESSGVVCFERAGDGAEVTLKMRYDPESNWNDQEQVNSRLQRNLQRFKALVEAEQQAGL